jgi:hypothetical protein
VAITAVQYYIAMSLVITYQLLVSDSGLQSSIGIAQELQ